METSREPAENFAKPRPGADFRAIWWAFAKLFRGVCRILFPLDRRNGAPHAYHQSQKFKQIHPLDLHKRLLRR
ncbi:MAG: hypothetical protein ACN6OP_18350, partial [Pseudomonadales bacterium]